MRFYFSPGVLQPAFHCYSKILAGIVEKRSRQKAGNKNLHGKGAHTINKLPSRLTDWFLQILLSIWQLTNQGLQDCKTQEGTQKKHDQKEKQKKKYFRGLGDTQSGSSGARGRFVHQEAPHVHPASSFLWLELVASQQLPEEPQSQGLTSA